MNDKCHPGHHTVPMHAYAKFKGFDDSFTAVGPFLKYCQDCNYRSDELVDFRYTDQRRGYCRSAIKCASGGVFVTDEAYIKGKLMGAW